MIDNEAFEFLVRNLYYPENAQDDTFLNSVGYYLITGRKGAWLQKGFDSFLVMCNHPNIPNTLLIFPELGAKNGLLTRYLLNHIDYSKQRVLLARYTNDDLQTLITLFKNHPLDIPVLFKTINEQHMDWHYPLHILDTNKVSQMDGSDFRNIRQKYRQAQKQSVHTIRLHDTNAITYAEAAHKYWLGNQIVINIDRNKNNIDNYYDSLFAIIKKYPNYYDGLILFVDKKPIGFSIWDKPVNKTVNLIANLSDTAIKGLSEYQVVTACDYLFKNKILYMNRGGSERSSLNSFKAKFSPCQSLSRISIEIRPDINGKDSIKSFDFVDVSPPQIHCSQYFPNLLHLNRF